MKEQKQINQVAEDTTTENTPASSIPNKEELNQVSGDQKQPVNNAEDLKELIEDNQAEDKKESAEKVQDETQEQSVKEAYTLKAEPQVAQVLDEQKINESIQRLKSRSRVSNLLIIALVLVCGGYMWYLQTNNQASLDKMQAEVANKVQELEKEKQALLDNNKAYTQEISEIQKLANTNNDLTNKNEALLASLEEITKKVDTETSYLEDVKKQLNRYEARDPDDWRKAQSYFLVSSAYRMAVFARDPKAALWCLNSANDLLAGIEEEQINKIREVLANDIMKIKNIPQLDLRGLVNKLDSVYNNLDKMTLAEVSTADQREQNYKKADTVTETLIEWKDNLLVSLKDFSSRFVEIRRRDEQAVNAFLSADQAKLLLENLKSQILLAKMAVYEQNEQAYVADIEQALALIKGYYNPETPAFKANIETLETLKTTPISVQSPSTLESYNLFDKYARQILRFNTPDMQTVAEE